MTYAPGVGVVMFGGASGGPQRCHDLWRYDGVDWQLLDHGTGPSERRLPAMAYDRARDELVVFGGFTGATSASWNTETWVWDSTGWRQANPSNVPGSFTAVAAAYDRARQRVVLHAWDPASRAAVDLTLGL